MIEAFSLKTAHLFDDALASQARLRYLVFVERRMLEHPHYEDMEYDEFDTPAAVYLVWRDARQTVRGVARLVPTTMPYMLETYWPFLCQTRPLPKAEDVWEINRVCVDRTVEPKIRRCIFPELLSATAEFCMMSGIRATVGVTRKHLLDHFNPTGIEWLGETAEIEGEREAAFWMPREWTRPRLHCEKYGIPERVLSLEPIAGRAAA